MSDDKKDPIDHKRYFNDPEYRKKILQERKEKEQGSSSKSSGSNSSKRSNPYFRKLKIWGGSVAAVLALIIGGYVFYLFQGLPSADEFENPETAIASE
ncbi:MAG TPA: hypothetical protein DD671_14015, partial [Balneolaceae bacterium]|nr:hypothetical protein [Balneolaceae bacterium]